MSRVEPENVAGPALSSGAVLGNRLRLEEPLSFLADQRLWRALDLRTRSIHAVEVLGAVSQGALPALFARGRGFAPARVNLQPFYRYETIAGFLYAIAGYDERLTQPGVLSAAQELEQDLPVTKTWLHTLFRAAAALDQPNLPPHGAIVPSRIAGSFSQAPLLTGYPYALEVFSTRDRPFLSPQRLRHQSPLSTDDTYGLAAISYWLLSLGKEPRALAATSEGLGEIDSARREKKAAPIDWPEGAEFALLSALQEDPARRPQRISLLLDHLDGLLLGGQADAKTTVSTGSTAPSRTAAPRALAPWRVQQLRRRHERFQRFSRERTAGEGAQVSVELQAELKALQADLLRAENDLARRETLFVGEREAFAAQKSALLQQQAALQRQLSEIADQHTRLEEARKALQREEEERKTRERELEQSRGLLRQEAEKQSSDRTLHQQEKNQLVAEQEQLRLGIDRMATERAALVAAQIQAAETERKLGAAREELTRREQALGLVQQELTKISGTADVRQWDFFVQQLRASKVDHERRLAALAKQESQENASRPNELAATGNSEVSTAQKEPSSPPTERVPAHPGTAPVIGSTGRNEPILAPPLQLAARATLSFSTGRRLHLFGGPALRFGRHGESDVLLVALQNGLVQTSGVNREISRKHFELKVDGTNVTLMDGWSDDGKPSQHGLCVDGRRVMPGGVLLRAGMMISVTTRQPSGAVPHWMLSFLSSTNGLPDPGSKSTPGAIFLRRLDDAPDDVLMILSKAALSAVGGEELTPPGTLLIRQGAAFAWKTSEREDPLAIGPSRFTGINVLSVGWCSPTVALA